MGKRIYSGKSFNLITLMVFLALSFTLHAEPEKPLINIDIGLLESLSPTAPSASERYKRLYESALYYAIGENERKLNQCGYKLTAHIRYFDTFDALDLLEKAKQINHGNPWIVIGPRRSSHIKTASKSIVDTPIVSAMANSDSLMNDNPYFFTMYPTASDLSKMMVKEVQKRNFGKSFGVIVDARCQSCLEFAQNFQSQNKLHRTLFVIKVGDNTPDMNALLSEINKHKPDYLLVPNYSELSGFIISETQRLNPNLKYVGSDGWGEDTFSFIQGYNIPRDTVGIAIRFGVKAKDKSKHYNAYSLEREINGVQVTPPYSIYSLVSIIRTLSDNLCESKPNSKTELAEYLLKKPKTHFQSETQYAIYSLEKGQLKFSNYVSSS